MPGDNRFCNAGGLGTHLVEIVAAIVERLPELAEVPNDRTDVEQREKCTPSTAVGFARKRVQLSENTLYL